MTASSDPLAIARSGLLEIQRAAGEATWIRTRGDSMLPGIPPGSRLLVDLGGRPSRPGQLVVFRRRDELVAHRFVARKKTPEGTLVVAKGDNESLADRPLAGDAVLGVVRAVDVPPTHPRGVPLEGRGAALVAHLSWWGDRAVRLSRRLLRHAPPAVRRAILAIAQAGSRIPVRVTVATMLRFDRSTSAGRR